MDMNRIESYFLQALHASLQNKTFDIDKPLSVEEWSSLFQLADKHHVFPMIYEAVGHCFTSQVTEQSLFIMAKKKTINQVTGQVFRTSEFLKLYRYLQSNGIEPLVVKGIVCRSIYPKPDHRISGDEDMQVSETDFTYCHKVMKNYGMECAEPNQDIETAHEVPYNKKGSPLYIELHKYLFPPKSEAYGDLNRFFTDVRKRAIKVKIDGTEILTMGYTDHLFYLICHAFKHFLHSGFGIRQVCDIVLFANTYGTEIDWELVLKQCREIRADLFTAALFRIGEKYLTFNPVKAAYPTEWSSIEVDESLMLEELLDAGVFGSSSSERQHSSTITLEMFANEKQDKKSNDVLAIMKAVFPSAAYLEGRYPELKKRPYLLPVVWIKRIVKHLKETKKTEDDSTASSIQIAKERIEIMKQYGILRSNKK